MKPKKTFTKGNIIVQDIKIGDIHYEFGHGYGIKCKVLTVPKWDGKGWIWQSENIKTQKKINYYVSHEHSHYASNLYDYEAYKRVEYI